MAIPAFYAPLSILLRHEVEGRLVRLTLQKVEVDIESFLASQRPLIPPIHDKMTAAKKKKAKALLQKWEKRQAELEQWLAKATTWQHFVDFWAVDWAYGERVGEDGKPIFDTDWQSFRLRKSKKEVEPLVLTAQYLYDQPGNYRVAARITDVFGNDGIAAVTVEVR
jgi:adenine-specific DNA-methyltransferase